MFHHEDEWNAPRATRFFLNLFVPLCAFRGHPPCLRFGKLRVHYLLGLVRVVVALATGEELAADVTIAALLGAIGCVLLAQLARRSRS